MKTSRAFTLIELLVAISIIAIMALLTITGAKQYLGRAQLAACSNNLRSIGEGAQLYNADHQYFLPWYTVPPSASDLTKTGDGYWWQALAPYVGPNKRVFRCPADKNFSDATDDDVARTASYGWNYKLTGHGDLNTPSDFVKVVTYSKPSRVLIATDGAGGASDQQEDSWGYIDERAVHEADPVRHFGKSSALFLDGHVERLDTTNYVNNPTYFVRTNNP
ncbi:hypothetical protein BH09VER1_BH09VER1_24290 [soil metagenome]